MISVKNLFLAWYEFKQGKEKREDVQLFQIELEKNLFELYQELITGKYRHGPYKSFYVFDPKCRHIQKAGIRDRVVHQAIYSELVKIFEPKFIYHSYSCRKEKGTHKGVLELVEMTRKISRNYTIPYFYLKFDILKFFDNVDHNTLMEIIARSTKDKQALALIYKIISSYVKYTINNRPKGLPIGNLTSQIFCNIYLNELDYFIKQKLRIKYYCRYSDDCVLLGKNADELKVLVEQIKIFLKNVLFLALHPQKSLIKSGRQGIDFLGYNLFPLYNILRTRTKKRMFKKMNVKIKKYLLGEIDLKSLNQSLQSYLGILSHAKGYKLQKKLLHSISKTNPF